MHMTNTLKGAQSELSMDAQGVGIMAVLQLIVLGLVALRQLRSFREWRDTGGQSKRLMGVHPAILLLTLTTMAAVAGSVGWSVYFIAFQHSGTGSAGAALLGRAGLIAAKTLLSILLLLLAR